MTPRSRDKAPTPAALHLDGAAFVKEIAKRQGKLLQQMAESVQSGALVVNTDDQTDRYIESLIADWASQEQPTLEQHMALLGAVFAWALLDLLDPPDMDTHAKDHPQRPSASPGDIAIEALRTAAAIWGKR